MLRPGFVTLLHLLTCTMKWLLPVVILASNFSYAQKPLPLISKIAFGSCAEEDKPQPILNLVVKHRPDVFVYLGDNIYGDTNDTLLLKAKYDSLAAKKEFQNLKRHTRLLATWDDHDYGANDIGKYYIYKEQSKKLFLDFFGEPLNTARREREGIYTSYMFEGRGRRLQVILLDGRTFRNDLKAYGGEFGNDPRFFYKLDYSPQEASDSTLLGEAQWKWLEGELQKPADLRIIGSGSQFGISFNGYEAWANFPHEQKRFLQLVKKTKANGVMFISGDVHYAEISRLKEEGMYPVYDVTASGITSTWHFATPNSNRIEGPVMDNHFGLITIDWQPKDPVIKMEVWDVRDNQRIEYSIKLSEISFKR